MAQRGRPRKTQPKENNNSNTQQQETTIYNISTFEDFAKAASQESQYLTSLLGTNYLMNPYWMNTLLKTSEGNPTKYKRDEIVEALNNPIQNEQKLRNMHLQFYHTNLFYKRIIKYFSTMLIWKYYVQPEGVTREDIQSKTWQNKYSKMLKWVRKFDLDYELQLITEYLVGEDTGFFFLNESEEGNTFMKLPQDYCKIIRKHGLYYEYAFNFMYFLKQGAMDVDDFNPWFRDKFDEIFTGKSKNDINGMGAYLWVELPYDKAPCFKFNQITSAVIPTFVGAYLDILSIMEYRDIIKSKTLLDATQIIHQRIPLKDPKDPSASKSPFLIDSTTSGKFHRAIKEDIAQNQNIRVVTTPMELSSVKLERGDNKDNIIGMAENNFYKNIGTSSELFNGDNATGMSIAKSIMTDEAFVLSIQKPVQYFLNICIKKITGKYDIKLIFPPLTYYNQSDKLKEYQNSAQYGVPGSKSLTLCALGINAPDSVELGAYEDIILDSDTWKPLQSSHTLSGDDNGGRPQNSSVSDSKINSQDHDSNVKRGTGTSY